MSKKRPGTLPTTISTRNGKLTDNDTGEVISVTHTIRKVRCDQRFQKAHVADWVNLLSLLNNKQANILGYILYKTDFKNNFFTETCREIQTATGVSLPTVSSTMKNLQNMKFLKKIKNGVWMLSPKLLYMGDDQKYEYLCSSFRYETDNA
jgi:L-rhamnose mutarotase